MKPTTQFRQMLISGEMVVAPFVLNALHAKIAESVGFQAVYMTARAHPPSGASPTWGS